jgi:hypothetical protein
MSVDMLPCSPSEEIPMKNPPCIYCGLLIDLDSTNYIVMTDSFDWVGHAHCECQVSAEILGIEALSKTNMRVSRSVPIPTC